MRVRVHSALLTTQHQNLIADLADYGHKAWADDVEVNGVDQSSARDAIKKHIRTELRTNQNGFCAYCGLKMREKNAHIDHVAPKKRFKNQTFNARNLVLTCYRCNFESKSTFNPVARAEGEYEQWEFCFVHPILDDPRLHISRDKYFVWIESITEKGATTIDKFGLVEPTMIEERAKQAMFDNFRSPPQELLDLLEKVESYVP